METVRVLIVDDEDSFRSSLRIMMTNEADIEVVGEATTGDQAVSMALLFQPDVILMDVRMDSGTINGIDATRQIVRESPHIRILILTMWDTDESIFASMRAGAWGFMVKGATRSQLLRSIRAVSSGEAIFGTEVARRIREFFANMRSVQTSKVFPELSMREHEVLELLAQGNRNADIAEKLSLSTKTVRNHVSNILDKLQVTDRTQAIIRAKDAGMG